jgi:peptide/nickel transport system substrate-binding protein
MRRLPRPALVPLLSASLVVAAGCSGGSGQAGETGSERFAADGSFTMAVWDDFGSFDPYRNPLVVMFSSLAYDSLINRQHDGKLVSGLAEKWSADARSATFTLRGDVTCSDGTPLTASQVASAIRFVSDPKNQSAQYGVNTPTVPLTVTADDADRTVRVVPASPYGLLLHTIGRLPIMCAKGMKDPKLLATGSDGTGPFVLTKAMPSQGYTFSVRKGYTWGPGGASTDAPGTPATVTLKVVANDTTAANLLLSGEVNFARITGEEAQRLDAERLTKVSIPLNGAGLTINQIGNRPTTDKRVRQALVQALDRDELIKVSTGGNGAAATGLISQEPKVCPGDTLAGQLPEHDVATAESVLDQAGWTKDADGVRRKDGTPLTIGLHYATYLSSREKPTAELIAQRWRAAGIQVQLSGDSLPKVNQALFKTHDWDIYTFAGGYSLPSQLVQAYSGPTPPGGLNIAGIRNKEFESLVSTAASQTPPQACDSWNRAEQALYRNVDVAPIATYPRLGYLRHAELQATAYQWPIPTSIRVTR